jgi:DNA repair protein SbcC/Rad50
MIPLKLQIKNFLSYGPTLQTIDFEPYHLICLSGKNGHGKSALLDAITWALWGQARKISGAVKADAHLLHLGQMQMLVIVDFTMNGQTYRVRREYTKGYGKTTATLDFGVIDPATGACNSLTTNALRTTQEIIEDTIGLSYDSFINTAFLRQGNSNEFSKKSAKDRKDILSSILGLQQYDRIRVLALEKVKQFQESLTISRVCIQKLEQEIAIANEIVARRPQVQEEFDAAHQAEQHLISTSEARTKQETLLLQEQHQYQQQQELFTRLHEQLAAKKDLLLAEIRAWRATRHTTSPTGPLSSLEQQFRESAHQCATMQAACQKVLELKQTLVTLTAQHQTVLTVLEKTYEQNLQVLHHEQHAYTTQISTATQAAKELQNSHEKTDRQLQDINLAIETITKEITALHARLANNTTHQFEKRKRWFHEWTARANIIKAEYHEVVQKITAPGQHMLNDCPLCEQPLTAELHVVIHKKWEQQKSILERRLQRLTIVLPALKQVLLEQHQQLETTKKLEQELIKQELTLQQLLQSQKTLTEHIPNAQQNFREHEAMIKQLTAELEKSNQRIRALQQDYQQLQRSDPALQKIETEISRHNQELIDLNHDETHHQAIIRQHEQLAAVYQAALQSAHTVLRGQERKQQLRTELVQLQTIKRQLRQQSQLEQNVMTITTKLAELAAQKIQNCADLQDLRQKKELLLQELGKISHAQHRVVALHKELETEQAMMQQHTTQIEDYLMIATALGKDGVQALLIEDAIPEIEHEANALLAQLTDNQTHLFIDSLRDLKRGGSKETLDIKISDAAGIRPYELFSGGEAFRIDFALRIAISKLLARRAGTSLQTLIIDEGFGSQDDDGLAHIMDAILRIQHDFCKVIIVSHLSTMKEQFPVHFVVHKNAQGSVVHVLQQG